MTNVPSNLEPLLTPIDSLRFDPANARTHSVRNLEAIKSSLAQFGQVKPIVVQDETSIVVAGNGTLEAARELGWDSIAVVRVKMSQAEATSFAIADNRTAELAEWDDDTLAQLIGSLTDDEELLLSSGFTEDEIANLFDGLGGGGTESNDEDADDLGMILFSFGSVKGRVSKETFDAFLTRYNSTRESSPTIDEAILELLG